MGPASTALPPARSEAACARDPRARRVPHELVCGEATAEQCDRSRSSALSAPPPFRGLGVEPPRALLEARQDRRVLRLGVVGAPETRARSMELLSRWRCSAGVCRRFGARLRGSHLVVPKLAPPLRRGGHARGRAKASLLTSVTSRAIAYQRPYYLGEFRRRLGPAKLRPTDPVRPRSDAAFALECLRSLPGLEIVPLPLPVGMREHVFCIKVVCDQLQDIDWELPPRFNAERIESRYGTKRAALSRAPPDLLRAARPPCSLRVWRCRAKAPPAAARR